MRLGDVVQILDAVVLTGAESMEKEVSAGCGCDLMSDVLAFIKPGSILLTGLNNVQAVRTAEIAEIRAICFVRGKHPSDAMIETAQAKGIILLATAMPLFEACGRLFMAGLKGSFDNE